MKGGQDMAYLSHFHTIHIVLTKIIQTLVVWYLTNHETVKGKKKRNREEEINRKQEILQKGCTISPPKTNLSFSSHQCHDK